MFTFHYFFLFFRKNSIYILMFLLCSCNSKTKKEYTSIVKDKTISTSKFIGSQSCKECHSKEFSDWEGSHHDQAMKIADSTTILANFNNTSFTYKNVTSKFFKKEKNFYVNTQGDDGKYHDYKIIYTFGVFPLQQYIVKFPKGKYQCLTTAWDVKKKKWFNLSPDIDINHKDWLHWSRGGMNWNNMCSDCHSTNVHENYNDKTETYKTTFSEINVSCESCHGPSSTHVDYYKNPSDKLNAPKLYMNTTMTSTELVDKCARCHSRRSQQTAFFDYKGSYLDHYSPSLLTQGTYELDGQIKDEDYVYGSFTQSKMYHNGVSCKDCHDVHSLKLKKIGNALCLQCHKPKYDTPSHHFHKMNTESSQCINCHMTGKYYMGNDFRRDHSFRVPRPDQTVKYNTPNACNGCHTDKTAKWASDFINSKYGDERADHFSDHLLKGYFDDVSGFHDVFSNGNYPDIARATAVKQFASQPLSVEQINDLMLYLQDSSALVRNEVIIGLERINIPKIAENIKPLLNDSLRLVRISAARYFNMTNQDVLNNKNFKKANKEFLEQLKVNADFASGQHQLGIYYQAHDSIEKAINSYKKAITIDSYFNQSRMNLALLYYQQGKTLESENLYLKVIEQEPNLSHPYYMLGLLYNEIGKLEKSLKYLKKATEKQPANQNAFYNYALKLQENKRYQKSIDILKKGLVLFPNNERLLYAKLLAEININDSKSAYKTYQKLLEINPNNTNYQSIFKKLQQNN